MAFFFASAFMVFCFGLLACEASAYLARAARKRGSKAPAPARRGFLFLLKPEWRARLLLTLFVMLSCAILVDAMAPGMDVGLATLLSGPAGARVMAGALAGAALLWGVARTRRMHPSSLRDFAGLAVALTIPIVVFLASAFLANPGAQGVLRSLEIGGVAKLELAGAAARGGQEKGGVQRALVSQNGGSDRHPQLGILQEYSTPPANGTDPASRSVFARDVQFLTFLGGADWAEAARTRWRHQQELLNKFNPFLQCLQTYVERSRDRPLIAVKLAEPLLHLAMLERGWRRLELAGGGDERRHQLTLTMRHISATLDTSVNLMRSYLSAAGPDTGACADARVMEPLSATWTPPVPTHTMSPYVAIFAAWSFSSVGSYELAIQTLAEWVDDFRRTQPSRNDPIAYWFELRTIMEMAAIALVHESSASESRLSRRLLDEALRVMNSNIKVPSLAQFDRERRPRCGATPPEIVARRLLWLRAAITERLLHAVIDNEDGERELGATDVEMAHQLRNLDVDCLPGMPEIQPVLRKAYEASYRGTYGRVLWAWAGKGERTRAMTSEAVAEFRDEAKRLARGSWATMVAAESEWRREPRCGRTLTTINGSPSGHDCSWGNALERDVPFAAERARVRSFWLDVAATAD